MQEKRNEQAPEPAVPVEERVNRFELSVDQCAFDDDGMVPALGMLVPLVQELLQAVER